MSDVIKIEAEFDLDKLRDIIEKAKDLNDNPKLFKNLVEIEKIKNEAKDIVEQVEKIQTEAKGLIDSKAKALYGNSWEGIKGNGYKISRSPTGSVFDIIGTVQKKFKVVKESVDTKLVEKYIKEKGKLPAGLEYNKSRGHSIRITVKDNEDS